MPEEDTHECTRCGESVDAENYCVECDCCWDCHEECENCGEYNCRCDCVECDCCGYYNCECDEETEEDEAATICPACGKPLTAGAREVQSCHCLRHIMVPNGDGNKYPHFNPKRLFGVEIECYNGRTERYNLLERLQELAVERYGDKDVLGIVSDPSIRGSNGLEIRVGPVCGDAGLSLLARTLVCLRARGFSVNPTCGLHVHHDLVHTRSKRSRKKTAEGVINFYYRYHNVLDRLFRDHRHGTYCHRISGRPDWGECDRYGAVNLHALRQHGTLEFRQHHATLAPASVISWVLLSQLIVEKADNNGRKQNADQGTVPYQMREFWRQLIDPGDKRSVAVRRFYLKQTRTLAKYEHREPPRFSRPKNK